MMFVGPASTLYCFLTGTAGVPAYCLLCAGPPSMSKTNTTCTSRPNLRGHPATTVIFYMDGGGAGRWPGVCRPTRHHDGHPSRLRIGFRHGWWGPTCIPMCAVTCAGAPGTRCACPEHGTPGAAGACGTLGARGARSPSGAPGVPGTLGRRSRPPQRDPTKKI